MSNQSVNIFAFCITCSQNILFFELWKSGSVKLKMKAWVHKKGKKLLSQYTYLHFVSPLHKLQKTTKSRLFTHPFYICLTIISRGHLQGFRKQGGWGGSSPFPTVFGWLNQVGGGVTFSPPCTTSPPSDFQTLRRPWLKLSKFQCKAIGAFNLQQLF